MSGWTSYDILATYLVASFFFVMGAITLLAPMAPGEPPAWLVEARLRYGGDINVPVKRAPSLGWMRVSGLSFVFLGILQLLPRRHLVLDAPFLMIMGGFMLVIGLGLLVANFRGSGSIATFSEKRQRRRFERRVARGTDAYFEELRTILSQDPPPRRSRLWETVMSAFFPVFSGAMLALGVLEARR